MRKLHRAIWLLICLLWLAACQGPGLPPQQRLETAEAEAIAQHIATLGSIAATNTAIHEADAPIISTAEPAPGFPTAAPTIAPTSRPTPDPFPTPVIGHITIAEQRFEGGWMFWLQPNRQIWLLSADQAGRQIWSVYDDSFVDGDAEYDPNLAPPENRFQPVRGFGKLWRENLEVRQIMGWALSPEVGHSARYEYRQGGHLNDDAAYVPGPGYHLISSVNGETFRFNEENFTWSTTG